MRLEPGMKAPHFARPDQSGKMRSNDDFTGSGLVVYFYPKAFTPGCTTESCDFRDNHQRFLDAGYAVVGVSPDPIDQLAGFRDEYALPFPLLSDEDHSMASSFGAWGMKKNYGREYEGIIRSTFVIDGSGSVEHAWYNVKAKAHVTRVANDVLGD
jgi:peroxiredoxin Q/BCP